MGARFETLLGYLMHCSISLIVWLKILVKVFPIPPRNGLRRVGKCYRLFPSFSHGSTAQGDQVAYLEYCYMASGGPGTPGLTQQVPGSEAGRSLIGPPLVNLLGVKQGGSRIFALLNDQLVDGRPLSRVRQFRVLPEKLFDLRDQDSRGEGFTGCILNACFQLADEFFSCCEIFILQAVQYFI